MDQKRQNHIEKARFVLDRFHMGKYIIGATSHLLDSADDAREKIYHAIRRKKKGQVQETFEKILAVTEGEGKRKTVESARDYVLGNWPGIMERIKDQNKEVKCSAEGHVSHIYADRMSSRPLGWSRTGADRMSRLRIYAKNGGNMLELVRFQKEELPKAAGCETVIYSSNQMFSMERKRRENLGVLANMRTYSIPYTQVRKIANLKEHIFGL